MFDLTGRIALVTGSSRGIGRSMAEGLAEQGARVVISSRKEDVCKQTAAELNQRYGEGSAVAIACNAGYKEQIEALVEQTHSLLGPIDILISNVGVNPFYGPSSEIPDTALDKILSTNIKCNHWLCHLVAKDMVEKNNGSIMITASTGAFTPSLVIGTYHVSKLADIALVRNLALEYGPHGVRVNAICPGVIKTDFSRALWDNPEAQERAETQTPLRRLGEADDLKGVAVFLASDESSYITGQALTVCGGTHMWS
jgi:NAD(P)-dependent dehydrogenase (short-subunit alcohol dehydrogenase family)